MSYKSFYSTNVDMIGLSDKSLKYLKKKNIRTINQLRAIEPIDLLDSNEYVDILVAMHRLDVKFSFENRVSHVLERFGLDRKVEDVFVGSILSLGKVLKWYGINTISDLLKYTYKELSLFLNDGHLKEIKKEIKFINEDLDLLLNATPLYQMNIKDKEDIGIVTIEELFKGYTRRSFYGEFNIKKVGDLLDYTRDDLIKLFNNEDVVEKIERVLKKLGLKLPTEKKYLYIFDLENISNIWTTSNAITRIISSIGSIKLENILKLTTNDLLKIPYFGMKRINELKQVLESKGLYLSDSINYSNEENNNLKLKEMLNKINNSENNKFDISTFEKEVVRLEQINEDIQKRINEKQALVERFTNAEKEYYELLEQENKLDEQILKYSQVQKSKMGGKNYGRSKKKGK